MLSFGIIYYTDTGHTTTKQRASHRAIVMLAKLQPAGACAARRFLAPQLSLQTRRAGSSTINNGAVASSSSSSSSSPSRRVVATVTRGTNHNHNAQRCAHVVASASAAPSPTTVNGTGEKCFVTTPIYYVNDRPHIGHVYTSTVADVYARFQRSRDRDVFFLTGTDEHGQKVEQSAETRGVSPQDLADENSASFRSVMESMDISFDGFIRTTDASHKAQVRRFVELLKEKDAVYLGKFEGWYDAGQEEYYTETKAKELDYKSPISGKDMVRSSEENYYFKLSAFQSQLEALHNDNPDFLSPPARRNEMLGRLAEGLNDVPISRTNFTWGVGMPGDEKHVIYVWIDALLNYITALGLAEEEGEGSPGEGEAARRRLAGELKEYWPASVHVMAKEISWFHAVIWPALLMALELPLPDRVHAHAFWIRDGKKMSKSLGNFVDLEVLSRYTEHYGLDGFRYFLMTEGPIGAQDANFASSRVQEVYSTDLVNTLGNSLSRTSAMVNKYYDGGLVPSEIGASGERVTFGEQWDWPAMTAAATEEYMGHMEALDLPKAAAAAVALVVKVDLFITETEPFRMAKDESKAEELGAVLYQCLETLRIACVMLESFLPNKMAEVGESLELGSGSLEDRVKWGGLTSGSAVKKMAIFPRVEALDENGMPVAA